MNHTYSQIIKSETALAHARTEKAMMTRVKNINSVTDYANLLYCLYGYFTPVEDKLNTYGTSIISDYDNRRKADAILQDLQLLNCPKPKSFAKDTPIINDLSKAFGCLYVMEGSILGGSILKRRILAQCPSIPDTAFSYFSGYQQQTSVMWQAFLNQFNEFFSTNHQIEAATSSANECFEKLEIWIEEYTKFYPVATPAKLL